MLRLAIPPLSAACAALLLAAAPAIADPATTGGVPAIEPPTLSPQGGVDGPRADAQATVAQAGSETGGSAASRSATPPAAAARTPADSASSAAAAPVASAAATQPAAGSGSSASAGGGGGLPRTGFALAALVAIGIGFVLTGYALRYSRTLDG